MPRYDYECQSCHHRFELKQSFSSEPVATCPKCESASRRVIHSVPIVFKGSGWYVNDYGKRGGSTGAASDSKDSAESKSDEKSESKAKSDSKPKSESESSSGAKAESKGKTATAKTEGD